MRNLGNIDAWITREDEPNVPTLTCDVCDRRFPKDEMHHGEVFGIETTYCERCRDGLPPVCNSCGND